MQTKWLAGIILALSVVTRAADKAQYLNVKTGLWEVRTVFTSSGELPIPAGLLEKLTPEQRARVEERRNTKSSETQRAIRKQYCLSKARLVQGPTFGQDRKSCKSILVASTAKSLTMQIECANRSQLSQTLEIETADPEHVAGSMHTTIGADQPQAQTSPSTSTFTARWVASTCSTSQ